MLFRSLEHLLVPCSRPQSQLQGGVRGGGSGELRRRGWGPGRIASSLLFVPWPSPLPSHPPPPPTPHPAGVSAFPTAEALPWRGAPALDSEGRAGGSWPLGSPPPRNGRALGGGLRAGRRCWRKTQPSLSAAPGRGGHFPGGGGGTEQGARPGGKRRGEGTRVRVRACWGALPGAAVAAAHPRQLEFTTGALLKSPNQTLRRSPASAGAVAGDRRARRAPTPRLRLPAAPSVLRRPKPALLGVSLLGGARPPPPRGLSTATTQTPSVSPTPRAGWGRAGRRPGPRP